MEEEGEEGMVVCEETESVGEDVVVLELVDTKVLLEIEGDEEADWSCGGRGTPC